MTRYWSLGGGSLKGAWQIGAMAETQRLEGLPDGVTCTSVGALNGAHLAAFGDAEATARFWLGRVTGPAALVRTRRWWELGWRFLAKDWAGAVDTAPLEALVRAELGPRLGPTSSAAPALACHVSSVNVRTGKLEFRTAADVDFLDGVLASTAEPVAMPARRLRGDWHVDGGVRAVAPLAKAIREGADDVVVFCCQPAELGEWSGNYGDLFAAVGRDVGIAADEILRNDLERCGAINDCLDHFGAVGPLAGKRKVRVRVVYRSRGGPELDIMGFGPRDIADAVAQGRADARAQLA